MTLLLRQYQKTMLMEAAAATGESPLFVAGYLLRLLRVLALLAVWRTVYSGHERVSGVSLPGILTYSLISEVYGDLLACRTGLEGAWFNGSITTRFLRPISLFHQFSAEMFGRALVSIPFFSLPLLAISPWLGVAIGPVSPLAGIEFLVSLAASVGVGLALEYFFVGLAVAAKIHPYAITNLRNALTAVLSGALIPLALMPWGIGRWLGWLPFASQASAPLRIYTGSGDAWRLISLQCLWIALLWPAASWIWWVTREKMVSFGG